LSCLVSTWHLLGFCILHSWANLIPFPASQQLV
jgi:hypothetical protein